MSFELPCIHIELAIIHRGWAILVGRSSMEKINLQTGERREMAPLLNYEGGRTQILIPK